MRLIAENLSGERGGEAVFSGVGFALGAGDSADRDRTRTGPANRRCLRVVAGPAAAGGGQRRGWRAAARTVRSVAAALPLSRPPQRHEAALTRRGKSALLAAIFAARRMLSVAMRAGEGRPGRRSATCRSAICRPASGAARRSPGCWSATARSGCSTSRPPGSTRRPRRNSRR